MMQVTSCMEDQDGGNVVKRLSVPVGLEELMTGLTKEVLQKKPKDIYNFASDHFAQLLALRDNGNYQQAPTKSITYASKGNVERHLLNGKTPSTKSSDGTPTKLSRQVSIRAASPTRKNGPKIRRSGTPKHENNNNKEAKLKDKQDNKKPVSSRRQTPGSKSKFDNLEPVQEDALKTLTKRQSLSRRSTDRKSKTDSENSRDSKRSSSEESEKKKRPSRDASLKKKTAEKKMQSGDSKEAKDKKNGQEKLKRKKEETIKNSIEEASDTKNANETEKAQAVSTFGLQHSSEIYDTICPTETSEESFKDQSKPPIKALGLQHSGEIHDTVVPTEISERSSKDQSKSPVEVPGLQNGGETHDTVIPTEISDESFKDQPNPLVKGLGLQHSGETHDTVIPTAISEESSIHQSNPPVEVPGLQHSGEVHDTVIPTEESFEHHSVDKNENVKDDLQEKFILKSQSIEESTTGIKDGRLTVTPPKILKGVQTTLDDFDVPTTLVVPVLATTGQKSPAESISAAEQTGENKTEGLHEDSETGETVTSSKDEDENKDVSLTKYDSSILRKELQQVEEESKLNNFTSSYNPHKLKQEIRNASKEVQGEQGVGSTHLSTEFETLDKKSEHSKEDEKVIKDRTEDTEQDVLKEEDPYAKKISHEEAKEKTIDVTLQQPKVSGQIENNKLQLLHAQTAVSEGSTTGSVEGTSLDNKEMPEEEVIEDNELQKSLTAPDTTGTKTPVRLGSTSKLQHSGELHDQVIPNQSDKNENAITAVDESLTKSEKTPTTLESISGLQHSGELHDEVIPKESDENRSAKAADVKSVVTPEKTPAALESISGLQHSGELHDQVISKESDENKSAKVADVEGEATSGKTPTALESISGLQHSGKLHDQVISKESDENRTATAAEVEAVAKSGKSPTSLELISGLQHSGELHDQVIPKESDENKGATTVVKESLETLEKPPTAMESISGLQHSGELHDKVIPKESDENKSATTAVDGSLETLEKTPTALESISGLQHSGELHDQVIPKESDEHRSAEAAHIKSVVTPEKTLTALESISGCQHSGELHDQVISKESDENRNATGADVEQVATPEKTPTVLESISGLQHSGELHDQAIPKESDENKSAAAADIEPVATSAKTPTVLESISGLQYSGELHDQAIPKESDESKSGAAADIEPVNTSAKTPTVLESISGLQHSGELHDQAIPKESDENKSVAAADIEPVATSAKTPTVLESISGLQHSGEQHDQLIPKHASKDETEGSALEITKSPVALQAMSGLQHSGELHDQLIPKENEENIVASDLKTRSPQEAPSLGLQYNGELHDELIAKVISEEEAQKSPVVGLQHSGELHDNLISKSINGVDTGKSPDLKQVRKMQSDEIPKASHENIEDKKELEQSLEGSSGSVIAPSENVKEQSKVKDVETSKQEIDETAAKLTLDETIAQAASKIQAGVRGYLTRKLYNKTPSKDASTNNRIDSGNKLSDKEVQDALTQLDILPVPSESPYMSRHKREVADIDLGDIRMEDSSGQKDKLSRSKTVHGVETEKSLIPNLFKSLSVTDSALSKTLDDDEDKLHDSTEESVSLEHTEDLGIGSEKSAMLHSDTIIKNIDEQQTPKESSTASLEHSGELHDIVTPKESEKAEGTNYLEVKKEEEPSKVLVNGKPAEELKSTTKEFVSGITDEVSAAKQQHLLSSERQHSGELHDSSISQNGLHDSDKGIMLKTDVLQHVIPKELQQESQNKESVDKLDKEDSLEIGKVEQKLETEALQHSGELHDILLPKEASKEIQDKNKLLKDNLQHSGEMHDLLIPNHSEEGQEDKIETVEGNGQHTVDGLSTKIQGLSKEIQHDKDNLQHSGELHDLLQPNEVKAPACEAKHIEDITVAGIEDNDKVADKDSQELQDGKIVVKDILQHSGELHDVLIAKEAEKISQKSNNGEKDKDNFQHTAAQNDFSVPAETKNISEKTQENKTLPNEIERSLQEAKDIENLREKGTQVSDKPSDKVPQELQDGKALKQEVLEHSGELHDILIPKHIEASFQKLHDNNSNKETLQHSGELHDILVPKTVEGISQELENDIQSKKKDIQDKAQEDPMRDLQHTEVENDIPRPAIGDIKSTEPSPDKQQEDDQQSEKKDIQENVKGDLMRDLQHTAVDGLAGETDDIKSTVSSADDQQKDNQQPKQNDIQEKVKGDLIANLHDTEVEDGLEAGTTDDTKSTEPSPGDQQEDLNKKLNNMKSKEADDTIKQATSHDSDKVDSKEFAKQESGLASINGLQHSGELHDLLLPQNDISENPEIEKEKVNTQEEIQSPPASTTSSASINDLQKTTYADVIQHSGEMHDILIPQEKLTKTDTHNESFVDSPETVGDHQAPKENYEKEQTTAGQFNAIEARSGDHFTSLVLDEQASVNTTATSSEKDSNHQKAVGLQHAGELHDTLITEETKKDFPDEETKDDSKPLALNQVQNVEVAKVECSGSENSLNQPYTPSVLAEPPKLEDKEGITSATPSFHSQHNTLPASSETYTISPALKDAQKKIVSGDTSLATITEPLHNELKTNTEHVEPLTKHTQELVSAKMPNTDEQLSGAEDENLLVSQPNSHNEETSQIKKAKPLSAGTKPEKDKQKFFSQDNNLDIKTVGKQIDEFTKEDLGSKIVKDNKIDEKSAKELPQTREDASRNKQDSVKNDSMKDIEDQILKSDEIDSISGGSILQEPFEHATPRHDLGIDKETDSRKTSSDISKFRTELEKVGKEAESIDHVVLDVRGSSPNLEQCIEEEKGGRSNTPSDISKLHSELKETQLETEKGKTKENGESSDGKNVVGDEKSKEITIPESKEGKIDQKDQKLNVLEESAKSAETNEEDCHEQDRKNDEDKPEDGKHSKTAFDISKLRAELEEAEKEIEEIDHAVLKVSGSSPKLKDNIEEVKSVRSNTVFDISKLHSELEGQPKETGKDQAEENGITPCAKKVAGDEKFIEVPVPERGKGKVDQENQKLNVLEENAKSAEINEEEHHVKDLKTNEDKSEDDKHSKTSFDISKLRAEKEIEEIDHAVLKVSKSSPKLEDNIEEVKSARSNTAFDISKLHSELEGHRKETKETEKDEAEENGRSPDGEKVVGHEKFKEITVPESGKGKVDQKDKKLNVLEERAKSAETNEEDYHEEDRKTNEDKPEDGKQSKTSFDISNLRAELEETEKEIEKIDHAGLKVSGSSPKLEDNIEEVKNGCSNTAFDISKLHSELERRPKETEKNEAVENGRTPGGKKVVGDEKFKEIPVPESGKGKVDQQNQKLNVLDESAKSAEINEEDHQEEYLKNNQDKPEDDKHSETSSDISKPRAELEEAEKEIDEVDHAVLKVSGSSPKLKDNIEEVKSARSNAAFDIPKLHSELEGLPKETEKDETEENGRSSDDKTVVGDEKFKEITVQESGKGKVDQKDQKLNVLEENAKSAEINEEDHQKEYLKNNEYKPEDHKHSKTAFDISKLRAELEEAEKEIEEVDHAVLKGSGSSPKLKDNIEEVKSARSNAAFDISKLHSELEGLPKETEKDETEENGRNSDGKTVIEDEKFKEITVPESGKGTVDHKDQKLNVLEENAKSAEINEEDHQEEYLKNNEDKPEDDKHSKTSFDISKLRAELEEAEKEIEEIDHAVLKVSGSSPKLEDNIEEVKSARSNTAFDVSKLHSELEGPPKEIEKDEAEENGRSPYRKKVVGDEKFKEITVPESGKGKVDQKDQKLNVLEENAKSAEINEEDHHEQYLKNSEDKPEDGKHSKTSFDISKLRAELEEAEKEIEEIDHAVLEAQGSSPELEDNIEEVKSGRSNTPFDISKHHSELEGMRKGTEKVKSDENGKSCAGETVVGDEKLKETIVPKSEEGKADQKDQKSELEKAERETESIDQAVLNADGSSPKVEEKIEEVKTGRPNTAFDISKLHSELEGTRKEIEKDKFEENGSSYDGEKAVDEMFKQTTVPKNEEGKADQKDQKLNVLEESAKSAKTNEQDYHEGDQKMNEDKPEDGKNSKTSFDISKLRAELEEAKKETETLDHAGLEAQRSSSQLEQYIEGKKSGRSNTSSDLLKLHSELEGKRKEAEKDKLEENGKSYDGEKVVGDEKFKETTIPESVEGKADQKDRKSELEKAERETESIDHAVLKADGSSPKVEKNIQEVKSGYSSIPFHISKLHSELEKTQNELQNKKTGESDEKLRETSVPKSKEGKAQIEPIKDEMEEVGRSYNNTEIQSNERFTDATVSENILREESENEEQHADKEDQNINVSEEKLPDTMFSIPNLRVPVEEVANETDRDKNELLVDGPATLDESEKNVEEGALKNNDQEGIVAEATSSKYAAGEKTFSDTSRLPTELEVVGGEKKYNVDDLNTVNHNDGVQETVAEKQVRALLTKGENEIEAAKIPIKKNQRVVDEEKEAKTKFSADTKENADDMEKIQSVDISDSKTLILTDENKQDSKENAETKDIAADRPKSEVALINNKTIEESKEDNERQDNEKQIPINIDAIESAKLKLADHSELKTKSIDNRDEKESKEAEDTEKHILFSTDSVDHSESTSHITDVKSKQDSEADNETQKSINEGISATLKDNPALEVPLMHNQNDQEAKEHEDKKEKISVYAGESDSSDHLQSKILFPSSKNIDLTKQDNGEQPLSNSHEEKLHKPKTEDHPESETLIKNKENSEVSKEDNKTDAQIMPTEEKFDSQENQVISTPITNLKATPLLNNISTPVQSADRNPQNSLPDESLANIYKSAPTRPVTSDITPNISPSKNIQIPSENLHKQIQDIEQIIKPDIESDENLALASKNVNKDANAKKIGETKHVSEAENSIKGNYENDEQNKMVIIPNNKTVQSNQNLEESSYNEETKSVNSEHIISDDKKTRTEEDLERPVSITSTTSADSVATVIALSPRELSAERKESLVRSNSSEKPEDNKTDTQIENNVCNEGILTKHVSQEENRDVDRHEKHEHGKTESNVKEAATNILDMTKLKSEIEEKEPEMLKHKPIESFLTKSDQENENLPTSLKVNNANNENSKTSNKESSVKEVKDGQVFSNETLTRDSSPFEAEETFGNGRPKNDVVDNHNGQELRESPDLGKHAAATTIQNNYRGYRVRRDLGNRNLNSLHTGAEIFDKKEEKQSRENSPDINEHIKETLLQHIDNEDTDEKLPQVTSTAEKDSLSKNSDKHSKASNQPLVINALGTEDKANWNIKDISREESVTHISPVFADASSNFQKPEEMGEERNGNDPKIINQVPETNVAVSTTDENFSAKERDSKMSNKSSGNSKSEIDEDTTIAETTSGKLRDTRVSSEDLEDLKKSELSEDVKTEDSSLSKTDDEAGTATPLLKQHAEQGSNSKTSANEVKGKDAVSAKNPKLIIPLSELDKKPEEINRQSFHIENKNINILQHNIATAPPLHLLEHEYDNVSTNPMANSFNNDVPSNSATAPPLTLLKDINNQHAETKATDHLLQSSSINSEESSSSKEVIKSVDPIEHLVIPKKLKEENQSSALDINSQDNLSKLPHSNKKNENVSPPTNLEGEQSSEKMGSKNIDSKYVDMLVSPRFQGNPEAAVPKALDVVLDQQLAIATPNAGERQESIDSEGPEYIHIPLKGSIELSSKEASNSGLQHSGKLHDTIDTPLLALKQDESCKELRLENKSEECNTEVHAKLAAVDDFSSSKYDLVKGDVSPRTLKEEERAVPKALGVVLDQQLAIATPKGQQKQDTSKSKTPQYIHIPLKGSVGDSSSAEKINSADASTSGLQHTGEIHDMLAIPPLDLNPEDEAHKSYNLAVKPESKEVSNIQDAPTSVSATDDFTSSKYDLIESGVSPRVRKEVEGAIPKALGAILDQQLAITTPRGEDGKVSGKPKEPEYIYIPLKDPEDIANGLQHSGEFHDTIPIPLPESKQVIKENPVEKSVDSAQKQKIETSTENVLGVASNEWDSSKYDLVKGGTIPRIRKEQEGAVPKVLGTVLDQQLAITAPLAKSKEVENDFVHPEYVHIPLKDTNELSTSKEDNLNNGFQSDGTDSSFRERSLTNGPDKENSSDSAQGKELTIKVHDQDINKSPSYQEENKSVTFQEKELTEEHQGQEIDNLAISKKKEPTHLVLGGDLCKSLLPQERDNITTSVFNAEQLTNGQYPTTKLLLKEDLQNEIRGGHEVDKKVDIPLKSQSQKLEEAESKSSNLNLQLQKTAKSSLGDSATEHTTLSPVNSSLDLPISPTSVVNHKAEDLNKPKVEEPPLERTLAAKLSSTNVNHKEKTATLDLASKRENSPTVSPISNQPSSNRLTDNTVLLLPTERDQQNSPIFDLPPQHLQNGTPTFGLQLRFSPSPTRNMERRPNSETGNVTPTIDGNENLNSAREDRSIQSESPPIVIQSTQISDNTMPLAVQLNQPPGAPVLTSPTPNDDDDDDDAGDCPAAHASEKGASTKVEAQKNRAHFRTSMETDKRKNATIKENNMEEVAATKIQAGFRGYQVRKQLKLKNGGVDSVRRSLRRKSSGKLRGSEKVSQKSSSKPSDLEEKSATKIQAGIRGFLVRRRQQKKAKNSTTPESS